jgi:hypothetical protein
VSDTMSQMTMEDEAEAEEVKEEQWAIVDDENMDNFYHWYPKSEQAIVYPFELDLF